IITGLHFFASGAFLYSGGGVENIGKAAACRAVRRVYLALKRFLNVFITFPGNTRETPSKRASMQLYYYAEFPNVIGAVDCSQISIKAPSEPTQADFVNRKSFHTINVQVLMTLSLT
ncbi:HARB1 nuclease, partial [Polyodon spathula]|nr:HARB1 nuclease [Polyodon spathula]